MTIGRRERGILEGHGNWIVKLSDSNLMNASHHTVEFCSVLCAILSAKRARKCIDQQNSSVGDRSLRQYLVDVCFDASFEPISISRST